MQSYLDELEPNQISVVGHDRKDGHLPIPSPRSNAAPRVFKDDSFFICDDPCQHDWSVSMISFRIESQIGIRQFKQEAPNSVYLFTLRIGDIALKSWYSNQDGGD